MGRRRLQGPGHRLTLGRSGPLKRTTGLGPGNKPLQRKTRLENRSQLERKPPPRPRPPAEPQPAPAPVPRPRPRPKQARARTGAPAAVLRLVDERDGRLCVRCGRPASNRHHREPIGAGGTSGARAERIHGAEWLLTLCGEGNTSGCHKWVDDQRQEALRHGYVISRNGLVADAARRPVLTVVGWRLFPAGGGKPVPCPEPPEGDARLAAA